MIIIKIINYLKFYFKSYFNNINKKIKLRIKSIKSIYL